jgi:hypothetical protein
MKHIYVVIKYHSFMRPYELQEEAYESLEAAVAAAKYMNDNLSAEEKPEHDEWGLVKGCEYEVMELKVK